MPDMPDLKRILQTRISPKLVEEFKQLAKENKLPVFEFKDGVWTVRDGLVQ